jgi:hypothetical protein
MLVRNGSHPFFPRGREPPKGGEDVGLLACWSHCPSCGTCRSRQTFVRRCQNCVAWAAVITRRARPARPRPAGQSPKVPFMPGSRLSLACRMRRQLRRDGFERQASGSREASLISLATAGQPCVSVANARRPNNDGLRGLPTPATSLTPDCQRPAGCLLSSAGHFLGPRSRLKFRQALPRRQ